MLESYVTKTRDKAFALSFMRQALKRYGLPEAITTDDLRSAVHTEDAALRTTSDDDETIRTEAAELMDRWIESVMIYPNGTDGAEGGYCCAGIGYGC